MKVKLNITLTKPDEEKRKVVQAWLAKNGLMLEAGQDAYLYRTGLDLAYKQCTTPPTTESSTTSTP